MPICVECKHYRREDIYPQVWHICLRGVAVVENNVTGEWVEVGKQSCEYERSTSHRCGHEGNFFEKKKSFWSRFF